MRRIFCLLILTTTVAACGSGDDDSAGADVDRDAGSMVQALSLMPQDDDTLVAIVNDYAAAGEALGLDQPGEGADDDEVADWFIPITTGREDTVGGLATTSFFESSGVLDDAAWRDEVGWAPVDVDVAVELQTDDGPGLYGFLGDFDPDAIEDAVTDDDNPWADELDQDGTTYVWGDDPEAIDPDRVTNVRPLGRGGSMAVLDEHTILWSWNPDVLEDGVAAATGEEPSLADSDELGPLAEATDDLGAMGAAFGTDAQAESDGDGPTLEPYEAFATGVRVADDGPEALLAFLHEDDDTAQDNLDAIDDVVSEGVSTRIARPWSEMLDLEETDTDGPVSTAVLELEDVGPNLWLNVIFTRDTLLAT